MRAWSSRRMSPVQPPAPDGFFLAQRTAQEIELNIRDGWFAELAQLVEQRFRKARVAGSNPALGSSLSTKETRGCGVIPT